MLLSMCRQNRRAYEAIASISTIGLCNLSLNKAITVGDYGTIAIVTITS
jgi:hypothetical protein